MESEIQDLIEKRKDLQRQLKDTPEFKERTRLRKLLSETTEYLAHAQADALLKASALYIEKTEISKQIKDLKSA